MLRRCPLFRWGRGAAALVALAAVVASSTGCSGTDRSEGLTSSSVRSSASSNVPTTADPRAARPSPGCDRSAAASNTKVPAGAAPDERRIKVDGTPRRYLVSVAGTRPNKPAPVVVLLHGMGLTASRFNKMTDFPERAARSGVVVVTPEAEDELTLWRPSSDGPDAAFIDGVLDELERSRCIDTARVHVAGFSVGAALAAAYACARQDRIASIVTVAVDAPAGCSRPMSILAFHGTADPVVPYGNDDPNSPNGPTGTWANLAAWAATAGCGTTPAVTDATGPETTISWSGCQHDAEVVLVRVNRGGHDWPGGATSVGKQVTTSSATDAALAFFARHPRTT